MSETQVYWALVLLELVLAAAAAVSVSRVTAPYGRHTRAGWGPGLPVRLTWVIMESPAVFAFAAVFALGPRAGQLVPCVLAALWLLHYGQRTFGYPLLMRVDPARRMPLSILAMGFVYNLLNAYLNARWLTRLGPERATSWLYSFRFLSGASLFFIGFAINRWADAVLRRIRKDGESRYAIPRGGLYEIISCPNYFGELVQWSGWALAAWSPAGLAFVLFTAANLVPRARSHHRWYQSEFPEYPSRRRAVLPLLL
jgi:protein-S-isoprenylcysteine O-methyltransferase Ste14